MKRGDFAWLLVFIGLSSLLVVPATQDFIVKASMAHEYLMGFVKFAILATMGELLALRIVGGSWSRPSGLVYKAIVWGFLGICLVLIFEIFSTGVAAAINDQLLFAGNSSFSALIRAFYVSAIMNIAFAPTMMLFHRIADTYIDLRSEGMKSGANKLTTVIERIDWQGFINFVLLKTIPIFWIPAHTITFLIPDQYRVLYAAYLSLALGAILAYAKKRKVNSAAQLKKNRMQPEPVKG